MDALSDENRLTKPVPLLSTNFQSPYPGCIRRLGEAASVTRTASSSLKFSIPSCDGSEAKYATVPDSTAIYLSYQIISLIVVTGRPSVSTPPRMAIILRAISVEALHMANVVHIPLLSCSVQL